MQKRTGRAKWAAAIIVLVAAAAGTGTASGTESPADNAVANLVTPCRLIDTRPAPDGVGPRQTPLGSAEALIVSARGTNGNCTIPTTATGIITNVTIVGPTSTSHLTLWPADQDRPNASNLNWVGGQAPTPNQVTVALSPTGTFGIFNNSGTVNVIVDVVGYTAPADLSSFYTKVQVDSIVAAATADPCAGAGQSQGDWSGCDLAGRTLTQSNFISDAVTGANFAGSNLSFTNLDFALGAGANFGGANLTNNNLREANFTGANFSGVNLTNAYLHTTNFRAANLTGANLSGANLTNADLTAANLTGVTWSNTTCPDLTNSNNNGNTCMGHL